MSLVKSDKNVLDVVKLVGITNQIQAVCLTLANDDLVPVAAQEYFEQANELLIKAMRAAIKR